MSSSRVNKYEKRRKNTKLLSMFTLLGSFLVIVLLGLLIFGGGNTEPENSQTSESSSQEEKSDSNSASEEQDESAENNPDPETDSPEEESESTGSSDTEETETEQVEPSDDNVAEAYTGDWEPVGTKQSEPHSIDYNEGSQDREEMQKAVAKATGLNEDHFTMWWIERNGDGKVVNTVSDSDETETYRVYNKWVLNEGWQPVKVEKLKKNDQKWRFE
ncbi:hypothetical protein GCM10007063_02750 [Lentibacillus kapialis]|uniref:DUF1510 domain-containing protein n=1 Tax=Lentibacillus kapialis TaxID=340214 RepID=A0A917UT03_9BACI|nr:YrrS family protein [Lentibacillus kapialis]GGJ83769.1 hypothetical protein GCM10007063_02750 [Lentibacillus kapialis]